MLHSKQLRGLWTVIICLLRPVLSANFDSHNVQSKGFRDSWTVFKCWFRWLLDEYVFVQIRHLFVSIFFLFSTDLFVNLRSADCFQRFWFLLDFNLGQLISIQVNQLGLNLIIWIFVYLITWSLGHLMPGLLHDLITWLIDDWMTRSLDDLMTGLLLFFYWDSFIVVKLVQLLFHLKNVSALEALLKLKKKKLFKNLIY